MALQRCDIQPQLEQGTAVGGKKAPAGCEGHQPFEKSPDELGARMEMQFDCILEGFGEELVLDDLGRHAGQGNGVVVVVAGIA